MVKIRLDNETFINRAIEIHGDKYDYSLINYINSNTNITIICKIHGEFNQRPSHHLSKSGCYKCGLTTIGTKKRTTIDNLKQKFYEIHKDKYCYDYINCNIYKNNKTKLPIFCNIHQKIFFQTTNDHISGCGCPQCKLEFLNSKFKDTNKILIDKFISIHGDIYDYSFVKNINHHTKVKILCKKCNKFFKITPDSHIRGVGCLCNRKSKGENSIKEILQKYNIHFYREWNCDKKCKNPLTNRPLYFDFYLPSFNICIEFDGAQHFIPYNFNSLSKNKQNMLCETQYRDSIKTKFCEDNNINLIRIPYWELKNIFLILQKSLYL